MKSYAPPNLDTIPPFLREIPHWVVWDAAKKPHGRNGSPLWKNPAVWMTFLEAAAVYRGGGFQGVGFVLAGTHDLVGVDLDQCVDTDVLDGSLVIEPWASEAMTELPGYWELSPSGTGLRGFFLAPGVSIPRGSKKVGSREIYSTGRYLTVTGRALGGADVGKAYMAGPITRWLKTHMGGAASRVTSPAASPVTGDAALDAFVASLDDKAPLADWPAPRIRAELFPHLTAVSELSQEAWIRQGMILHHQFGGSDEGRELWRELSSQQPGYDQVGKDGTADEVIDTRWPGFDSIGPQVATLRSLLHELRAPLAEATKQKSALAGQNLIDEVLATVDEDALEALCRDRRVRIATLAPLDLTKLTNKVRAQLRAFPSMTGTPAKALDALVRRFLAPPVPTVRATQPMPPAFNGWVFVTQLDKFFNVHTRGDALTRMGFNALMNREVPPVAPPGVARPAADMCTDLWGIKVVDRLLYAPGVGEVFTMNGREYANLYDPDSVPAVPDAYSAADLAAIEAVKHHLHLMFQNEREENILLGWLAHNVQFPGRIIGWAPFIPGEPGVGKTFFSRLLRAVMGVQNVSEVNVASIATQFKGWAAGAAVNVLEEVKLHGTNKYDVMNNLKPYITNLEVPMERKGQDSCMVPNFTNYLLFSNFLNGIPIDNSERRYCCLPSKLTSEDAAQLLAEGHYTRLFEQGVDSQAGGLRKWLLELGIVPEVLGKRAPTTEGRAETIAMGESEAVEIGRQVIQDGAVGVTASALSAPHFAKAMRERGCHIFTAALRDTLVLLGFHRRLSVGGRPDFKWRGKTVTVYVRDRTMTADAIRTVLDASKDVEEDVL